jgi:signal transduction histidine kinase
MDAIFAAFPTALAILRADIPDYTLIDVNKAFVRLTNMDREYLLNKPFFKTLNNYTSGGFEKNLKELSDTVKKVIAEGVIKETEIIEFNQNIFNAPGAKNLYLQFKCSPVRGEKGNIESIIIVVDDVTNLLTKREKQRSQMERIKSRQELHILSEDLASQAATNKAQYESASQELDDFVYSVSHDLRAPLRRIDGFSQEILNSYVDKLDDTGVHYLKRIRQGAQDMGNLIDDLLKLSRISRKKIEVEEVDLGDLAKSVFEELIELEPDREISLRIDKNLHLRGDRGLLKAMLANLISNALKFTSTKETTEIEIGAKLIDGDKVFYISDNGVGFDSAYSHKLFKAFSRLHSQNQFSGTGIGLATVKRIMTLHGGTVWAESSEGEGATFYFKF